MCISACRQEVGAPQLMLDYFPELAQIMRRLLVVAFPGGMATLPPVSATVIPVSPPPPFLSPSHNVVVTSQDRVEGWTPGPLPCMRMALRTRYRHRLGRRETSPCSSCWPVPRLLRRPPQPGAGLRGSRSLFLWVSRTHQGLIQSRLSNEHFWPSWAIKTTIQLEPITLPLLCLSPELKVWAGMGWTQVVGEHAEWVGTVWWTCTSNCSCGSWEGSARQVSGRLLPTGGLGNNRFFGMWWVLFLFLFNHLKILIALSISYEMKHSFKALHGVISPPLQNRLWTPAKFHSLLSLCFCSSSFPF